MEILEKLGLCGIVPVVVLDRAEDAVPTANALLAGGIDVMEITFRTAAAADAIRAVAQGVPGMLVGAGTVLNAEQTRTALEAGAQFIVSPGFSREQAAYCAERETPLVPGCATPTEIMAAMQCGLSVLKFFPANVYGGLPAMKALSAPFSGVRFIPTGGVSGENLSEFAAAPFVHAVGGSWICSKADIAAGNFEKITALCKAAVQTLHSFAFAHVGVNSVDESAAADAAGAFARAFGAPLRAGSSSIFAGNAIEIMKTPFRGEKGHLGFAVNSIPRALGYLAKQGFTADMSSARYKGGRMSAVYLNEELGGFALHLIAR